jgi:hypothetical protein
VGSGGGSAGGASTTLVLSPAFTSVPVGKSAPFKATRGGASAAVVWTVDEPTCGTVDASGRYTAPANVPSDACHLRATLVSDASVSAVATVTVVLVCTPKVGLPADAPALTTTSFTRIGPAGVPFYGGGAFSQGLAVDPCNPATIYFTVCGFDVKATKAGLYKTVNAGGTWERIGKVTPNYTGTDMIEEPLHVRIDPKDPQHLYLVDGVRGDTEGFWVSHNGGETFEAPPSFAALKNTEGISQYDLYDIAVDPVDFDHLLLSFHSAWGWTDSKWNASAGILESKNGGTTWKLHDPGCWTGAGHAVHFLFNPELGLGDSNTWMVSTQGGIRCRTDNAGATWTQVSTNGGIAHGGGTVYYTKQGVLYASGWEHTQCSTDNGLHWTFVDNTFGTTAVWGDGTHLYTAKNLGPTRYQTSLETDGDNWVPLGPDVQAGPFEMSFDAANRILYSASWGEGLIAIKVP